MSVFRRPRRLAKGVVDRYQGSLSGELGGQRKRSLPTPRYNTKKMKVFVASLFAMLSPVLGGFSVKGPYRVPPAREVEVQVPFHLPGKALSGFSYSSCAQSATVAKIKTETHISLA